jgi:hypothetical protein
MDSKKYIGMDVHKEMCHRDESEYDSAVYRWAARRLAGHV